MDKCWTLRLDVHCHKHRAPCDELCSGAKGMNRRKIGLGVVGRGQCHRLTLQVLPSMKLRDWRNPNYNLAFSVVSKVFEKEGYNECYSIVCLFDL